MACEADELIATIKSLANDYELADLSRAAKELGDLLARRHDLINDQLLTDALKPMRNVRAFADIEALCHRMFKLGFDLPVLRRFCAQAMIDTDRIMPAIDMLNGLRAKVSRGHPEYVEAHGLLGRCYKQLYIDTATRDGEPAHADGGTMDQTRRAYFDRAWGHYLTVIDYGSIPATDWHSINMIALMARAHRDKRGSYEPTLRSWAQQVIAAREKDAREGQAYWRLATVGEAYLALNDWPNASRWLADFAEHPKVDAFMLFGTIRQLEQVWQLASGGDEREQILTRLKLRLSEISRGQVRFSKDERESIEALLSRPEHELEATLGKEGPKKVNWLKKSFEAARSIARVRIKGHENEAGHATGFLVRGRDFARGLGDEIFLLTNEHVIAENADNLAIPPQAAVITFDEDPKAGGLACKEIVCSSGRRNLDYSLVRLEHVDPKLTPPIRIAPDFLPGDLDQLVKLNRKAYIIGHPNGGDLSISLDDAEIVDLGKRRGKTGADHEVFLHYKTPTEEGNSGSPVFNQAWDVVGLHHAGPGKAPDGSKIPLRKLADRKGSHLANEGIALHAIANELKKKFGG